MEKQIEVWRWTSGEACEKEGRDDIGCMGGFFQDGMRWKDYLERGGLPDEYAEAMRRAVIKDNIRKDGGWHQMNDKGIPLFTDGKCALMSLRAWGDLLAAIWSEHDGCDYDYLDFYYGGVSHRGHGPGYVAPPEPTMAEALAALDGFVPTNLLGQQYNFPPNPFTKPEKS